MNYLAQFLLGIVGLLWNEPLYNYIISKVYTIDNQMDGEDAPRQNCLMRYFKSVIVRRKILRNGILDIDKELNITKFL